MTTITKEQYDELLDKVKLLEDEIRKYKVETDWRDTEDTLKFDSGEFLTERVEFEANYSNWKYTKENMNKLSDIFFIDIYEADGVTTAGTAISFEQMKRLRDYLSQKIEYLES